MDVVFQLIILLFSVIFHEISHGAVANILGDPTAKNEGRLTINPLKHIDPFGSILLPFILFFTTGGKFVFGWAKPVPFNPYFLKNPKRDSAIIGISGPASNIFLALFFGLSLRFLIYSESSLLTQGLLTILQYVVFINLFLAFFNLIPAPPLDGSRILAGLIPPRFDYILSWMERYAFIILFFIILFGANIVFPLVSLLFKLIVGF